MEREGKLLRIVGALALVVGIIGLIVYLSVGSREAEAPVHNDVHTPQRNNHKLPSDDGLEDLLLNDDEGSKGSKRRETDGISLSSDKGLKRKVMNYYK